MIMCPCPRCNEYLAPTGEECPVCGWERDCEDFEAHIAGFVLRCYHQHDLTTVLLPEATGLIPTIQRFLAQTPPETAVCARDAGAVEDVLERTMSQKQTVWRNSSWYELPTQRDLSGALGSELCTCRASADSCLRPLLSRSSGPDLPDYLVSIGFRRANSTPIGEVHIEVTGGYYSFVQGDRGGTPLYTSVFTPTPMHLRMDVTFARGDLLCGIREQSRDTDVANFIGEESDLEPLIRDIVTDRRAIVHLGSFTGDLEITQFWWNDKPRIRDLTRSSAELTYFPR